MIFQGWLIKAIPARFLSMTINPDYAHRPPTFYSQSPAYTQNKHGFLSSVHAKPQPPTPCEICYTKQSMETSSGLPDLQPSSPATGRAGGEANIQLKAQPLPAADLSTLVCKL